jgi:CBS domain-containing protein
MAAIVSNILDIKGHDIWTISPGSSAYEALELLEAKDVGALVVVEQGKVVGMFSERDYARKIILKGRSSKETSVADVMTGPVCYVLPWTSVGECMGLMTSKHVRHLPVMENEKLIGIVSIGDIVKAIITEQESVIDELKSYVDLQLNTRMGK